MVEPKYDFWFLFLAFSLVYFAFSVWPVPKWQVPWTKLEAGPDSFSRLAPLLFFSPSLSIYLTVPLSPLLTLYRYIYHIHFFCLPSILPPDQSRMTSPSLDLDQDISPVPRSREENQERYVSHPLSLVLD